MRQDLGVGQNRQRPAQEEEGRGGNQRTTLPCRDIVGFPPAGCRKAQTAGGGGKAANERPTEGRAVPGGRIEGVSP